MIILRLVCVWSKLSLMIPKNSSKFSAAAEKAATIALAVIVVLLRQFKNVYVGVFADSCMLATGGY